MNSYHVSASSLIRSSPNWGFVAVWPGRRHDFRIPSRPGKDEEPTSQWNGSTGRRSCTLNESLFFSSVTTILIKFPTGDDGMRQWSIVLFMLLCLINISCLSFLLCEWDSWNLVGNKRPVSAGGRVERREGDSKRGWGWAMWCPLKWKCSWCLVLYNFVITFYVRIHSQDVRSPFTHMPSKGFPFASSDHEYGAGVLSGTNWKHTRMLRKYYG